MQPELAKYGIEIITLSKDNVAESTVHKQRDNLTFTMLSDPKLNTIRQYGVEHHKALNFKTGTFMIYGIPIDISPSFKTMAIPTTLLIDEQGIIQWIDQADDYRIRSNNDRVLNAVNAIFDQKS